MSTKVGQSSESPTQKADDVRPPFDGPHKSDAKKNDNTSDGDSPAYVVAVTKKEKADDEATTTHPAKPAQYDPKVLKAKARALLGNNNIDPEQRTILKEILGPEEKEK